MADSSQSTKIEIVTDSGSSESNQTRTTGRSVVRSPGKSPAQKLTLQLDDQSGHSSPGLSPRSPCRPLSPHLGIVSKLYEEEVLVNELTSTPAVDPEFIEQMQQKKHHLHSPAKSPEPNQLIRKQSTSSHSSKDA